MPLASFELHLLLEILIFVGLASLGVLGALNVVSIFLSESLLICSLISHVLHCLNASWWSIDSAIRDLAFSDTRHTVDPFHTAEDLVASNQVATKVRNILRIQAATLEVHLHPLIIYSRKPRKRPSIIIDIPILPRYQISDIRPLVDILISDLKS